MAKKTRRLLAMTMALALSAGQILIPAAAAQEEEQSIHVHAELVNYLRSPESSETMDVTVGDPIISEVIDSKTGSLTTSAIQTLWSGTDENGAAVEGSETVTQFTGTLPNGHDHYQGGTVEGEEAKVTTETTTSTDQEILVTEEVTTKTESSGSTAEETQTHTQENTTLQEGAWDTTGEVTEGTFEADITKKWESTDTLVLPEGEIPDSGITIDMKPTEKGFRGEASGEVILLTEAMEIPEGAQLVYDENNNLIGYTLYTESSRILGTTETHGTATKVDSREDADGTSSDTTPDLDAAAKNLNIPITDESVITQEYDPQDQSKITAYVVTNTSEETGTLDAPEAMEVPESGTITLDDGSIQVITTQELRDEAGNLTGFVSRTLITDADGKVLQDTTTTQTVTRNEPPRAAEPVVTYTLPEKPEESTAVSEDGRTVTVTVRELLDDQGKVMGYEELTVEYDAEGNELFRNSRELFGTTTVTEDVTVSDPTVSGTYTYTKTTVDTYRVTAEETAYEDIETYSRLTTIVNDMGVEKQWQIVEIDGKLYYIYLGSMEVSEGDGHGDTSLMNPLTPMPGLMNSSSSQDLDKGNTLQVSSTAPESGFKYLGYGVNSSLNVIKTGGSSTNVTQFRLKSADGKEYYAHCIDFSTTIQSGHLYDIRDIENEGYYQQSGTDKSAAEIIRLVALNGYWGTESGVGSMEDVKDFLGDYLTGTLGMSPEEASRIVDSLTPGQAQAATQAALWQYGNKNNTSLNKNNMFSGDSTDEANARYLYDALLASATDSDTRPEEDEGVAFLDAEDITGGSITINEKVAPSEENNYAENLYNTDLSFTLDIEPAKLNGDLIVTVTVGDEEVKKVRLAGADDPLLPMGRITKNEDGSYTIPDIQIAEGVSVNLNLSGTQDLGTGVYIFTSMTGDFEQSQTLVTLASGERQVNLDMNMTLTVEAPTASVSHSGESQTGTRTDTRIDTKTDVTTRVETATTSHHSQTEQESGSGTRTESATVTVTTVSVKETKENSRWYASWLTEHSTWEEAEETPGTEVPFNNEIIIPDEEVPLADAPKTGDMTLLWAAVCLFSLTGIVLLSGKRGGLI